MNTVRIKGVAAKAGISVSTVRRLALQDPLFPKSFSLSDGVVVWDEEDIDNWLKAKKGAQDGQTK